MKEAKSQWIQDQNGRWRCRACGYKAPLHAKDGLYDEKKTRFCPDCGREMEKKQDEKV